MGRVVLITGLGLRLPILSAVNTSEHSGAGGYLEAFALHGSLWSLAYDRNHIVVLE